MAGQGINYDFTSTGADRLAGDFRKTGDSAALAAKGARLLSDALEKQRKATDVSAGGALALAKADKILADAEHVLADGALEAEFALKKEADAAQKAGRANDDSAAKTGSLAARMSELAGTGGIPGGGMGAAAAAAVALSPILVTVGTGLGGLALAAAGIIKPIQNAAQKTGGLQANMHLLGGEQQTVARGILGLGSQFGQFERQLQPAVLGDFNAGLRLAGGLMRDIQPVSIATGKALGGVLGQIDTEFRSGTWQQFFGFMARTAGPDTKQLGDLFTSLLHVLPGLLEGLQPIGSSILTVGTDAAKALGPVGQLLQVIDQNNRNIQGGAKGLDAWSASLLDKVPGLKQASGWITSVQHAITGTGGSAKTATAPSASFGSAVYTTSLNAATAGAKLQTMAAAVLALNTAQGNALSNQLAYSGDLIANANNAVAFRTALKASAGMVGLHTQKERDSFSAADAYISGLEATAKQSWASGKGTKGAADAIANALPLLDSAATKNKNYWQEVRTLKQWLDKLLAEKPIHDVVKLSGSGAWTFGLSGTGSFPSRPIKGHGAAAGWRVPGHGTGDTVPAMLTPGEAVVPRRLVPAVAPFLSANRVPGFAAGGLVPSYTGSVKGLQPWGQSNWAATITAMTAAFAAVGKQMQSAASSWGAAGPGGGAPAANAALARRMFPAENFAAWNYVAMRESGWNQFARNPSSGAYGIAQALPPTKYPFAGQAAGGSNPTAQISWMEGYMRSRYGGAAGAAAHERAFNWYGSGLDAVFSKRTLIGVGERGPERVRVTPRGRGGGEVQHVIELRAAPGHAYGQFLLDEIQKLVDTNGGGDVQVTFGRKA